MDGELRISHQRPRQFLDADRRPQIGEKNASGTFGRAGGENGLYRFLDRDEVARGFAMGDCERFARGDLFSWRSDDGGDNWAFDPPYALARQWDWAQASRNIFDPLAAKLAPDGIVVLRTDDQAQPPPALGPLAAVRTRTYGTMVVRLLKKTA